MELALADANTGRTVTVGDEIVVNLPENPTTGFLWRPDLDTDALQMISDDYEIDQGQRGAPGMHRFLFRVLREGPTALRLVRGREWEKYITDEFCVSLTVRI